MCSGRCRNGGGLQLQHDVVHVLVVVAVAAVMVLIVADVMVVVAVVVPVVGRRKAPAVVY